MAHLSIEKHGGSTSPSIHPSTTAGEVALTIRKEKKGKVQKAMNGTTLKFLKKENERENPTSSWFLIKYYNSVFLFYLFI